MSQKCQSKNFLIDICDSIGLLNDEHSKWQSASKLVELVGGKHFNDGEFLRSNGARIWARSTMPETWLNEYISAGHVHFDLVVKDGRRRTKKMGFDLSELAQQGDIINQGEQKLVHAMLDANYGFLSAQSFCGEDSDVVRLFAVAFDRNIDPKSDIDYEKLNMIEAFVPTLLGTQVKPTSPGLQRSVGAYRLTERERDVLSYLASGMHTGQIADKLALADVTVQKHLRNARQRVGAKTREQAVAIAMKAGVIDL